MDVRLTEGLGLGCEHAARWTHAGLLAATPHNAARRERKLAPEPTSGPGAAVPRRADEQQLLQTRTLMCLPEQVLRVKNREGTGFATNAQRLQRTVARVGTDGRLDAG